MINEVIDGLYIGDFDDAQRLDSQYVSINVAGERMEQLPRAIHLPWLIPNIYGLNVNVIMLNAACEIIHLHLELKRKVVVNCNMGMERAPLTVAWYLFTKRAMDFDDAYDLVKQKRPQTMDRKEWFQPLLDTRKLK